MTIEVAKRSYSREEISCSEDVLTEETKLVLSIHLVLELQMQVKLCAVRII
ncbi:MAG: hypothetical protein HYY67_05880 [Thaumarchaeota archaeon]|nr:hypothetical protein [Nitrososphaerota archaeon]